MFLCCFMKVLNECCKDRKYNKNYKITESYLCFCYLHPKLLLLGDQHRCHHLCHHHDHRLHPLQHPHWQRRDVGIKGTFCLSLRGLGLLSVAHNHHHYHHHCNKIYHHHHQNYFSHHQHDHDHHNQAQPQRIRTPIHCSQSSSLLAQSSSSYSCVVSVPFQRQLCSNIVCMWPPSASLHWKWQLQGFINFPTVQKPYIAMPEPNFPSSVQK